MLVVDLCGRMLVRGKKRLDDPRPEVHGICTASEDPDRRAIELLTRGDQQRALTVLMQSYGTDVYRYCYQVLRSRASADDVYQATFVQVFRHLSSFSGAAFRPWIYTIAHSRCMDAIKASRRWIARFTLRDEVPEEPDPSPSSEERLVAGTLASHLEECLGKLQPAVRIAVVLRYQEGFSYDEMACICRERPATLQARVARALPVLRRCLRSKGAHL